MGDSRKLNIRGIEYATPQHEEEFLLETSSDEHKEYDSNSSSYNVVTTGSDCAFENLYHYCSYSGTLLLEK